MKKESEIIFVYNANSGMFNTLTDTAHKIISSSTYKCNLCKLTYGLLNEKQEWKSFISSLPYNINFLHKEEFMKKYPDVKEKFPAVFKVSENKLKTLISAKEINKSENIKDLKKLVIQKLKIAE